MHILVAEDNAKQAELIGAYLRRKSHEVTRVADGRAVLDECRGTARTWWCWTW